MLKLIFFINLPTVILHTIFLDLLEINDFINFNKATYSIDYNNVEKLLNCYRDKSFQVRIKHFFNYKPNIIPEILYFLKVFQHYKIRTNLTIIDERLNLTFDNTEYQFDTITNVCINHLNNVLEHVFPKCKKLFIDYKAFNMINVIKMFPNIEKIEIMLFEDKTVSKLSVDELVVSHFDITCNNIFNVLISSIKKDGDKEYQTIKKITIVLSCLLLSAYHKLRNIHTHPLYKKFSIGHDGICQFKISCKNL